MWEAERIDKASPVWTWDGSCRTASAWPTAGPVFLAPHLSLRRAGRSPPIRTTAPGGLRGGATSSAESEQLAQHSGRARKAPVRPGSGMCERRSRRLSRARRDAGAVRSRPRRLHGAEQRRGGVHPFPRPYSAVLEPKRRLGRGAAFRGPALPMAERRCCVRTVRGAWGWGLTGFRGIVLQAPGWHSAERCEPRDSATSSGVAAGGVSGAGRDARGPVISHAYVCARLFNENGLTSTICRRAGR